MELFIGIFALCVFYLVYIEVKSKHCTSHQLYYNLCQEWGEGKDEDDIVIWLCNRYKLKPLDAYKLALMAKDNNYEMFVLYHKALRTSKI